MPEIFGFSTHQRFKVDHTRQIRETRRRSWGDFQQRYAKRYDMLEGIWIENLQDWVKGKVNKDAWEQVYKKSYAWAEIHNVLLDILQKTQKVYRQPAKRSYLVDLDEPEADTGNKTEPDEIWEEVVTGHLAFDYDHKMSRALNLGLIGGCLIRPFVREDDGLIDIQILTPNQFWPLTDREDPTKIIGLEYGIAAPVDAHEVNPIIERFVWDISDDARLMRTATNDRVVEPGFVHFDDKDNIITDMTGSAYPFKDENGLRLPFTTVSIDQPEDRPFNENMGEDLFDGTLLASWYDTQKEWQMRQQSHKQWVITGAGTEKLTNEIMDPAFPIIIPAAESKEISAQIFDLKGSPEQFDFAIDKIYERLATRRGMSLEQFKETAQRQTAEAQRIQSDGERHYMLHLQRNMDMIEAEFASDIRMVWNVANNLKDISDKARYWIDFADPYETDRFANLPEKLQLITKFVLSEVDLVLDQNPDLSRDEALDRILQNKRESRLISGTSIQTEAIGGAVPSPNVGTEVEPENEPQIEETQQQEAQ